ncbi:transmembrane protease serine 12-like [Chironomus tepperi]|uniref:transmembrane protease serine 12-like n=1 Tax=Chironomus tepperi TaxID=113505 RepID=UPI00391F408D
MPRIKILLIIFVILFNSFDVESQPKGSLRRILRGQKAELRQFPYVVSIRYRNSSKHVGGGALISPKFVLTAATVVSNFKTPYDVELHMGIVNIGNKLEPPGWTTHGKALHVHPEFAPRNFAYNLALVEAVKNVPRCRIYFGSIAPIFIDTFRQNDKFEGIIAGWGAKDEKQGPSSEILQYSSVNVVHPESCFTNDTYSRSRIIIDQRDYMSEFYCVIETSSGACTTDVGGPLDIFVKITDHLNWLTSIVEL